MYAFVFSMFKFGKGSFTQINPVLKQYKQQMEEKALAAVEIQGN